MKKMAGCMFRRIVRGLLLKVVPVVEESGA